MPLKTPKKSLSKKPKQDAGLNAVLQFRTELNDIVETANALTKALGVAVNTSASHRLLNMLKKDIKCSGIRAYTLFVKQEWHELRQFLPNYGVRGSTKIIDRLSLDVLCDYYTVILSLYKTYQHSNAEYSTRIGAIGFDELEAAKEAEDPVATIKRLKSLNVKAAGLITSQRDKITELQQELDQLKLSHSKVLPLGIWVAAHHRVPLGAFRDWVDGVGTIDAMGDAPAHFLQVVEGIESDIK